MDWLQSIFAVVWIVGLLLWARHKARMGLRLRRIGSDGVHVPVTLVDKRRSYGGEYTNYYATVTWRDYFGSDHEQEFRVPKRLYSHPDEITLTIDPADTQFVVIDHWRYGNPWMHLATALFLAALATLLILGLVTRFLA